MVGSGLGAENGVLIRKGKAIQALKEVRMMVFDKTGTITRGKPEVTDIVVAENFNPGQLLKFAASIERGSEHPLGAAILSGAKGKGIETLEPTEFIAVIGKGVTGKVEGKDVLVGSRHLMDDWHIDTKELEDSCLLYTSRCV